MGGTLSFEAISREMLSNSRLRSKMELLIKKLCIPPPLNLYIPLQFLKNIPPTRSPWLCIKKYPP